VTAVANNNLACIKGVRDLFESFKRCVCHAACAGAAHTHTRTLQRLLDRLPACIAVCCGCCSVRNATSESARAKATRNQLLVMLANRCVLLMHMGKVCRPRVFVAAPVPQLWDSLTGVTARTQLASVHVSRHGTSRHVRVLPALYVLLVCQGEECLGVISEMQQQVPGSAVPAILQAAVLRKQKKDFEEVKGTLEVAASLLSVAAALS
jgi:hypothetical protein